VAGIGQGNGASSHIWAAVSMPLFEVMCKEGLVALVIGAMSKMQRALAGFAFMDDMDLIVNDVSNCTEEVGKKIYS